MDATEMQRLMAAEPYLGYLGVEVLEAQVGSVALYLRVRPEITNHAGSIHGGAQYGLGEATAIALAASVFPERVTQLDLLTANAAVSYQHQAHGDLTARAALPLEECDRLRVALVERGRVRVSVAVTLTDAADVVATTLTVECAVRLRG